MYVAYQTQADMAAPLRRIARRTARTLRADERTLAVRPAARHLAAACEVVELAEVTHRRPPFAIDGVVVEGMPTPVREEVVQRLPFGTLLRFRKAGARDQPRVLIAAPMSGHFATLLRDTIRTMLADHDVYVTDWHNARDVPLAEGVFGLDGYTDHLVRFLQTIGPGGHLMAICQPCVAALSAVAAMAEDDDPAAPASLTLMAGPIDCRVSPTAVNRLAAGKDIGWFERNLITDVPWRFPGRGRRVYPGFMQLAAFMNMNRTRHVNAFKEYYELRAAPRPSIEQVRKAAAIRGFYEEYFAVADLPAEFFLETVQQVFQEHALPTGRLTYRGRRVDPSAIRRTALLTVEGERDDICSVGQTLAAHDLCASLRPTMRSHHMQAEVGHYGVFSGRRWQQQIYPVVREAIHQASAEPMPVVAVRTAEPVLN